MTPKRVEARHVERGDDRAPLEPVPVQAGRELVEPGRELQIDVKADARRLVREERECLVQRRQLGCDLTELPEGARPDGAAGDAVAHLVEVIGVRDDERPARQVEDVELDEVDAELDGSAERAQRVLRLDECSAAMADPEDASVPALELDHRALLRARRSHHHASGASRSACPTVRAAAVVETSSQNRSG